MAELRKGPSGPEVLVFEMVPDLARLASVSSDTVGDWVWVDTLECLWHRNQFSTLPSDGITVIPAASGGGNWERVTSTTAPDWLSQATWYVDPVAGDDENQGNTAANALATVAELNRRLSVGTIRQETTLYIPAGATLPASTLELALGGFNFNILGTPTVVYTGSIDAYVTRAHNAYPVTPTAPILTDMVADFSLHVGRRIRTTSGFLLCMAWISSANPTGLGNTTCRVNQFAGQNPGPTGLPYAVVPAPGNNYVIEDLPNILSLSLTARDTYPLIPSANRGTFVVRDLYIGSNDYSAGQTLTIKTTSPQRFLVEGCHIDGETVVADSNNSYDAGIFARCMFGGAVIFDTALIFFGGAKLAYCLVQDRVVSEGSGKTLKLEGTLINAAISGIGIKTGSDLDMVNNLYLDDIQIFGATAQAIQTTTQVYIETYSGLSGVNAGYGVRLGVSAGLGGTNQTIVWTTTTDKPNLQGTAGDIRVEALGTPITLQWQAPDLPFKDGMQRGTATLVAGTVLVTAKQANLRHPLISRDTPGGAVGNLSCPVATCTAADFIINSDNAGDTSTVNWLIPPMMRNISIGQANLTL